MAIQRIQSFVKDLDEILKLDPVEFDGNWKQIDLVIAGMPRIGDRINAWNSIAVHLEDHPVSKGMPYFRLGVLHLLNDSDETQAISFLERAYQQDQQYAPRIGRLPHRMGAYRLLSLVKGYLEYLRRQKNWETTQLDEPHRKTLIKTLLTVYDKSLVDIFDMGGHNYPSFFKLVKDKNLARFAIENYFCAENLLGLFHLQGQHIVKHADEYPLSRAIVGLLGGTLEAILADRLPEVKVKTLGGLISKARERNIVRVGTALGAISSLMLYFRNHIHADRDATQTDYFIDINVAKGCKSGIDWAISELLQEDGSAVQ